MFCLRTTFNKVPLNQWINHWKSQIHTLYTVGGSHSHFSQYPTVSGAGSLARLPSLVVRSVAAYSCLWKLITSGCCVTTYHCQCEQPLNYLMTHSWHKKTLNFPPPTCRMGHRMNLFISQKIHITDTN